MANVPQNVDLSSYIAIKHSWRGKYSRLFTIGTKNLTTYNSQKLELTNQWNWREIVGAGVEPSTNSPQNDASPAAVPGALPQLEFNVVTKKANGRPETTKYSTDFRSELLTDLLQHYHKFGEQITRIERFKCKKFGWSDEVNFSGQTMGASKSENSIVNLEVGPASIYQLKLDSQIRLAGYNYKDLKCIKTNVQNSAHAVVFVVGDFNRMHCFCMASREQKDRLVAAVQSKGIEFMGIQIKVDNSEMVDLVEYNEIRLGDLHTDQALMSLCEFSVNKYSIRYGKGLTMRRTMCLTELAIVERDPGSYSPITAKALADVYCVVRTPNDPQRFDIQMIDGKILRYASGERDSIIASLLDGARASGNKSVCVRMSAADRCLRWAPMSVPVTEEVESQNIKQLIDWQQLEAKGAGGIGAALRRFNANVSYSGLIYSVSAEGFFAENKEKLIHAALMALTQTPIDVEHADAGLLEAYFHAMRRLFASKAGFTAFTQVPGVREQLGSKVNSALRRGNDAVSHAAIETIATLMCPMHDNYDLKIEQLNKTSLLSSTNFITGLLVNLKEHTASGTGALVVSALLDFFHVRDL